MMICILVTREGSHTIDEYLRAWGSMIAQRVNVVLYESLALRRSIPDADTYIFTDVERMHPAMRHGAFQLYRMLKSHSRRPRILNHPLRTHGRYRLLRMLQSQGINRFQVRRATEPLDSLRYPVFLRLEHDHAGNRTKLLDYPEQLHQAIEALCFKGWRRNEMLVTEFCNTADSDGIYRKYAAFVVGCQIIPRHMLFGEHWMLKADTALAGVSSTCAADHERFLKEQLEYIHGNPHADTLRKICMAAHVTYGRIDYSLLDGTIQIWEINTNPTILKPPEKYSPCEKATHETFADRIATTLASLGDEPRETAIRFAPPWRARAAITRARMARYMERRRRRIYRWWTQGRTLPSNRADIDSDLLVGKCK